MDDYKIGEVILNELMKGYPLKELSKEVTVFLENIILGLMNNFNYHESIELRRKFVIGIAPYSNSYNTGMLWERYETVLRDFHKVDILLTEKDKYWINVERRARNIIKNHKS